MEVNDQRPEWLRNMAEKTWNLELIISGAATYMSSHLPELTDQAFYYFLDNLNREQDIKKSTMPLLAYCFSKIIAWVLPATFLSHFIMRAFWAGLVGLHTVFPAGIDYENLPGYRGKARELFEKRFGTLADYIARLDRFCNQMFAFAFTIVLFAMGLSIIYLFIFVFTNLIPQFFGNQWQTAGSTWISITFFGIAVLMLMAQLVLQRADRERYPRLVGWSVKLLATLPSFMLPFIYKPVNYLTMTFSSNISKRRFYIRMAVVATLVLTTFIAVFFNVSYTFRNANPYFFQDYFGQYRNEFTFYVNHYQSLTKENEHPAHVTIPNEVVEGPYLKIFVTYPKNWDQTLQKICVLPENLPDSLGKLQKRTMLDSIRIGCLSEAVRLQINDSLYRNLEWQFTLHPQASIPGIQAMVPTDGFRKGKNMITVKFPSAAKPDSLMLVDQVPFWY